MTWEQHELNESLYRAVTKKRMSVAQYEATAYNAASPDARDCACHQTWGEAGGGDSTCICPGAVAT